MKKRLQVLKKKKPKNYKFMGFDVETDPKNKNKFVLACIYSDDIQKTFFSEIALINEISKHRYRKYKFVATNLPFDFFASFQDRIDNVEILERNGRIYKAKFYQQVKYDIDLEIETRRKPITFIDTMNYMPASVKKLGQIVGCPKMDHPKFFPNRPKTYKEFDELEEYCMNDAKISYLYMQNIVAPWIKKQGLNLKTTIAGISKDDFQTNYLKETLFQEPIEVHKKVFNAYYGGRTEVFKRGKTDNVYCYDVNSLYPSVMLNEFPNPNKCINIKQSSEHYLMNYEGVSKVKVYVPDMKIPPLPYRENKGDKLIFPTGTFTGYYCHNELRNAIEYGCKIIKFYDGVVYSQTKPYFKQFVLDHYEARQILKKENNPLEQMEKGVLNNLYGKWAFNYTENTSLKHKTEKIDMDNVVQIVPVGDFFHVKTDDCEEAPNYSFPIFSAYTTAYARIKMYKLMKKYESEILYTDTDSIFITHPIPESTELGEFKLEDGYPMQFSVFIRPKVYLNQPYDSTTPKIKCKGLSRITAKQWDDIIHNHTVYQQRFMKHRTAIRKKSKGEDCRINEPLTVPKNLNLEDTKRVWDTLFNPNIQQDSKPIQIKP